MSEAVRAMFTEHVKGRIQSRPSLEQLVNTLSAELKTLDNTFIIIDGLDELRDNAHKAELLQTLESLDPLPQLMVTSRPVQAIHTWFTETAKPDRYRVSEYDEQNDQAEYHCDNCNLSDDDSDGSDDGTSSAPSSLGSSTLDFDIVDAHDAAKEDAVGKEVDAPQQEDDEWRWASSYRCDKCQRDVCVNCYEKHTVCLGCNSAKTTFQWAWPGSVIITAHLDDLERYILWRIDTSDNLKALLQNARSKAASLADQIVIRVQSESCKMFLLAKFHMNALEEQVTARELLNALETLPSNITTIYDSVFGRIGNMRLASTLERLLNIVATARRLLSTEALSHALIVQPEDVEIDELQLSDIRHLAAMCAGLLEIDHFGFVRLSHETIGHYIAQKGLNQSKSGHRILAEICLAYLQFDAFSSGACNGPDRKALIDKRRETYPFYIYATTHWGIHARRANEQMPLLLQSDVVSKLALSFTTKLDHVAAAAQFMWLDDIETSSGWDAEYGVHGLHISAYFGLTDTVSALLATNTNVDVEDCLQTTPLMYAAQAGHATTVYALLHSGADPGRICGRKRTALHRACLRENIEIVKQLVSSPKDIAVNALDARFYDMTALMLAVDLDLEDMVKLLLMRQDIDVSMVRPSHMRQNALLMAVSFGQCNIVDVLLSDGRVSVESQDASRHSALTLACYDDLADMAALLLKHGASMDAKDIHGGPPLLRAVDGNGLECVRVLIDRGADVNFKDFHGRGILHGCAINSRATILRHLLQNVKGLDPNIQDDNGNTPLHDAVATDSEAVARVLLDHGARTDIKANNGRTPLRAARDADHVGLFELLSAARVKEIKNADTDLHGPVRQNTLNDKNYVMPIDAAVQRLSGKALDLYLDEMGPAADSAILDDKQTLLHIAAEYGQTDNVRILLRRGANIQAKNKWGLTPLHSAALKGWYDTVTVLIEAGANLNERDMFDRTPLAFATYEIRQTALAFLLLKNGATFASYEADSLLPTLAHAIDANELEVVKILVEGGVPFQMKDTYRATPYQRAKQAGLEDIAQYLYDQARAEKRQRRQQREMKPPSATETTLSLPPQLETEGTLVQMLETENTVEVTKSTPPEVSTTATVSKAKELKESSSKPVHTRLGFTERELVLLSVIALLIAILLYTRA
ncbi:hypothetical protein VHEMI04095 [[Torrubiella] hemipterigena]|nr:hypothetical protein VHEMI04095 [[Torrubiella] hemipterigena]